MARTGVNYGSSGTYKSTAGKFFARYIYEVTGKKTLLLSMDGGGWAPMEPEIQAGIIEPYRVDMEIPLPILRKISQGYWPKSFEEVIGPDGSKITVPNLTRIDWNEVGGMLVEGLSSISQGVMRHLADKNIKTGQEATNPFQNRVMINGKVEVETFAGSSMAHYGFVQNFLYSLVMNFGSLPCHYVLFTALESRTEEDDRSTVYGPQIAGKKATNLVPSWVGDCLHSEGFPVEKIVKAPDPADPNKLVDTTVIQTVVRTYFTRHPDRTTGIEFPAKPRVTVEKIAELEKLYPGGFFQPTHEGGLDKYLHAVDRLSSEQGDKMAAWRAEIDKKFGRQPATAVASAPATNAAAEVK